MTQLVDPFAIEMIVGRKRHHTDHYARAVSAEHTVYILHSYACRNSRQCPYSLALDRGILHPVPSSRWRRAMDEPVRVRIYRGFLVPDGGAS